MKTSGFLLLVLISTTSFALKRDPPGKLLRPQFSASQPCENRPDFLTEIRSEFVGSLKHLPETVLVARDVEYYVEGKADAENLRMHGYQSFMKAPATPAKVLCGSTAQDLSQRFSLMAPTLIDTHKENRVGQSLWQFQLLTDSQRFSFWNLKTAGLRGGESLEDWIKSSGAQYKIYQKTHTEYELMLIKTEGNVTQYLSVRYDSVPNLK
ncbi:hypothetical protein [Bdellovibrio bacteriovorus]|uniref:Uncharacterized protein n=1 Tax=Bdellovibrio bacteriovorus TaxID=959 RepID=A0A1Z3N4I6_BDEBC|nr:hypothetical protein [Bdellovibrio bacteriovorus]ASD62393.1 hypothetical protein B9G79_01845 [Bdellovibrio bacteriovorus]